MFLDLLASPFLSKALLGGLLLSASSALIGVPLVLKRNSMLSDGLSHVAFGALALASALNLAPLPLALLVSLLASSLILSFEHSNRVPSDSKIAILSASALAFGTLLTSIFGTNTDLNAYLFGSILALKTSDILIASILTILTVLLFFLYHHQIFLLTFDETFAQAIGLQTKKYNLILVLLVSLNVVLSMRLFGALLVSCLLIFPAVSAKLASRGFHSLLLLSVVFSLLAFLAGFSLSYFFSLPTSSTVVLSNLTLLGIIYLTKCQKS